MAKKDKNKKRTPIYIVFLVEGDSDIIVLQTPISELIFNKNPDYEVRFLLQHRLINKSGDEMDDLEEESEDEEIIEEYAVGGDITSSSFVKPKNIEERIRKRFITPATKSEGLYPKYIAKIIHIVDLDGVYIPDENVIPLSPERAGQDGIYYDGEKGIMEAPSIKNAIQRNTDKRKNLDYLLSLHDQKIKIGSKMIPYEIYYFSSNMDHYVNNDPNLKKGKRAAADHFLRRKINNEASLFCSFFLNDEDSLGKIGYWESWDEIKKGTNSIRRHTNIDCLIRRLLE